MIFGDKCINYYTFKGDTLLQVGKESPLEIISYSIPLHNMKYPIVYGDSLYIEFEGEGVYCGDHLLKQKGTNKVVIDGNKVGKNRPDIQFDKNGVRTNIEYDTKKTSMEHHKKVVIENDRRSDYIWIHCI